MFHQQFKETCRPLVLIINSNTRFYFLGWVNVPRCQFQLFTGPPLAHLRSEPSIRDVRHKIHESLAVRAALKGDGKTEHAQL
jgi:hypothetical protein